SGAQDLPAASDAVTRAPDSLGRRYLDLVIRNPARELAARPWQETAGARITIREFVLVTSGLALSHPLKPVLHLRGERGITAVMTSPARSHPSTRYGKNSYGAGGTGQTLWYKTNPATSTPAAGATTWPGERPRWRAAATLVSMYMISRDSTPIVAR